MKQMKTFVDQMVIKQPRSPWFGLVRELMQ